MVFEALVVKGLVAIGHYAAAHMTAGVAAAVVHAAAGMTLAQIASATVTAGFVTGCVVWTGERIKNVQKGIKAIENGDTLVAIKEFGLFAMSSNVDIEMLPDSIAKGLEKMGAGGDSCRKVASWVKNHELDILKYIENHK